MSDIDPSRRNVLAGIAAAGVAAPLLAACGSSGSTATGNPAPATTSPAGSTGPGAGSGNGGIKTSDVPVGGGEILADQNVVITQPTAGHFKAFSATCTHQGCQVAMISGGAIICPCHGSAFSITDGSVLSGLATQPLAAKTVTVTGNTLTVT